MLECQLENLWIDCQNVGHVFEFDTLMSSPLWNLNDCKKKIEQFVQNAAKHDLHLHLLPLTSQESEFLPFSGKLIYQMFQSEGICESETPGIPKYILSNYDKKTKNQTVFSKVFFSPGGLYFDHGYKNELDWEFDFSYIYDELKQNPNSNFEDKDYTDVDYKLINIHINAQRIVKVDGNYEQFCKMEPLTFDYLCYLHFGKIKPLNPELVFLNPIHEKIEFGNFFRTCWN
jgi:hypothetical protein